VVLPSRDVDYFMVDQNALKVLYVEVRLVLVGNWGTKGTELRASRTIDLALVG
jgi:hypothetical protein